MRKRRNRKCNCNCQIQEVKLSDVLRAFGSPYVAELIEHRKKDLSVETVYVSETDAYIINIEGNKDSEGLVELDRGYSWSYDEEVVVHISDIKEYFMVGDFKLVDDISVEELSLEEIEEHYRKEDAFNKLEALKQKYLYGEDLLKGDIPDFSCSCSNIDFIDDSPAIKDMNERLYDLFSGTAMKHINDRVEEDYFKGFGVIKEKPLKEKQRGETPSYYLEDGDIQPHEAQQGMGIITDSFIGKMIGDFLKYLKRAPFKDNELLDTFKASDSLFRAVEYHEKDNPTRTVYLFTPVEDWEWLDNIVDNWGLDNDLEYVFRSVFTGEASKIRGASDIMYEKYLTMLEDCSCE